MGATATTSEAAAAAGSSHAPPRIAALDGLRGVAVVAVVLYHADRLQGGFLGVDLFFVLSGYLITTILLRSAATAGGVSLTSFWARRARRLLPALLVMLAIVVPVYGVFFATPTELTILRNDALSTLAYVANWQQIFTGQTYWAATLDASPLRHTWSLAVEEQFYVVWPLIAILAIRAAGVKGLRALAAGGALAATGLTITFAMAGTFSLNSLYLSTITRSSGLLAGAALAAWLWRAPRARRAKPRPNLPLEIAALAAAAVMGWMFFAMDVSEARLYEWGLAVSMVCGTTLVAASASTTPGPIVRVLHLGPLRYLGTISYGIYLWSWPIMQVVNERHTSLEGLPLLVAQLAFTLAAAQASWMLVERPILGGAIRAPRSLPVLIGATVAVAAIIVVATLGGRPTDPTSADTGDFALAATPEAPRLLVVGDSVPAVLAREGMEPLRDELGVSVASRAAPGCILLREQGRVRGTEGNIRTDVGPCNQGWAEQVATLQPDVVLVMFGQFANDEIEIDGTFHRPCDPQYQEAQRALLGDGLDELTSAGARVVIATAPWSSVSWVTDSGPVLASRMTCLNDLYRSVADERDDTSIVDLASYVCPSETRCIDQIDGIDLREDTVHFRDRAAELISRWLVPQVLTGRPDDRPAAQLRPDADPYCLQVLALVQDDLAPGDDSLTAVLGGLRGIDLDALRQGAPEPVRPQIEFLTDNWSDYLDALESLPPEPTAEDLQAALGTYGPVVAEVVEWFGTNC